MQALEGFEFPPRSAFIAVISSSPGQNGLTR